MKKAILATDLSKASDLLLECIPQFKAMGIEHITVFHSATVSFNYMEYSGYSMMVHIEARLINIRNKLKEHGFSADFVIKEGLPSQEIIDFAGQQPGATIIMGSKGFGFAKRNLIGSTTLRVIQQSSNPVLMIRIKYLGKNGAGEEECALETKDLLSHGLLLTDFSKNASLAFEFIEENLAPYFDQFCLLHVQDTIALRHHDKETIARFNQIDTGRLNKLAEELNSKTKSPVKTVLAEGAVVPEILREVKLNQISLIVMGTHGRSHFSDIVLGSTVFPVIQLVESNCLLIPFQQD
jgi:nucleotide-binding universal stress UspA family protein